MRLIEVTNPVSLPSRITIERGDLLLFGASGGNVISGFEVVEVIGPFLSALMLDNGDIVAPMGSPNSVMFLARNAGNAEIRVVTGDPFHSPQSNNFTVIVAQ